jgi:1,4-dihydroxy-2-naphthoate octaprenyltransferase
MISGWKDWFELSRPLFHSVGVLPFVLGTTLSWRLGAAVNWSVFLLGLLAVILIMLATYYGGEAYDVVEDRIAWSKGKNRFSGGSGVVAAGRISPNQAKTFSLIALLAACFIGILIHFGYETGPWTLPLGMIGILAGYCYPTPPIRWVTRGVGELLVGFSYGWLCLGAAFYLQTGALHPLIYWLSLPIGCTIFNVILLNEFPDYRADFLAGKRNLVVRLGRENSSHLYGGVMLVAWISLVLSAFAGIPISLLFLATPLYLMGGKIYLDLRNGGFRDKGTLERLCERNIVINLGTTSLMILSVALWL